MNLWQRILGRLAYVRCGGEEVSWMTAVRRYWNTRRPATVLRRLWGMLCGEVDCPICEYGGLHGENRYRLRKLGGLLFNDGAQIV